MFCHSKGGKDTHDARDINSTEGARALMQIPSEPDTLGGMTKSRIYASVAGALLVMSPVVAACGGSSTTQDTTTVISLVPTGKLIDVRTPEEFAAGYVKGAVNINVQSPDFEAQIAALDKDATYNVYCRSGNRSAAAVEIMRNAGFKNVVDLGAVEEAAQALSLPVVTE